MERVRAGRALLANGAGTEHNLGAAYQDAECSAGYRGHLCSNCGPNKSRTRTYECAACNSGARVIGVAFVGAAVGAGYLWFVSSSTVKDTLQPWGSLKVSDVTFCLTWYLQLLFVLATIPVTWPSTVSWLPETAEVILTSFSSTTSSLACVLTLSKAMPSVAAQMMVIQLGMMLVMAAVVILLQLLAVAARPLLRYTTACVRSRCRSCWPRRAPLGPLSSSNFTVPRQKQRIVIAVFSSLLFFYPTILQTTTSLFVCKPLDSAVGYETIYQVSLQAGPLHYRSVTVDIAEQLAGIL